MKDLKFLTVILGLACLLFSPTLSLAVWDGEGDGFDVQVDIQHNDASGGIKIIADWKSIEGASSYKFWVASEGGYSEFATNGNHFEINIGANGDFTFNVTAHDESGAQIKKSDDFSVNLPTSGGKYIGKGTFSLKSEYDFVYGNGTKWFGKETGSVNFLVYQETYSKLDGSKDTRYAIYGTGRASFYEVMFGGGYSNILEGNGTLSALGVLFGSYVPGDVTPCTIFLTFTTLYPTVYVEGCFGADCVKMQYPNWEQDYEVIGLPIKTGATYDSDIVVYEVIPKKVTFTLENYELSGPSECLD